MVRSRLATEQSLVQMARYGKQKLQETATAYSEQVKRSSALLPPKQHQISMFCQPWATAMALMREDSRDNLRETVFLWMTPLPAARCISG